MTLPSGLPGGDICLQNFVFYLCVLNGIPGFIGNTDSSKNFNFDRQCSHYVQATHDVGEYGRAVLGDRTE